MSRTGRIVLRFAGAKRAFRLGVGETEELDELFSAGLMPLLERCAGVHVPTVMAVLRIGLTGAGMHVDKAGALVERHVRDGYFLEAAGVAMKVIDAAAQGVPDDLPGESAGEGAAIPANPSPTAE